VIDGTISELIEETSKAWAEPKRAVHRGEPCPFLLACAFDKRPADLSGLEKLHWSIPGDIREFWSEAQAGTLFKDVEYGQWGTEILTPADALQETETQSRMRPRDYRTGDLVLGRFLGDQDLLVLRCDESQQDFASVYIALPLDSRSEWPQVACSFCEFLQRLMVAQGDKFWEASAGR
jgi:hypothetical protein